MANALSRFGDLCRDIRTANSKTMGDQADALGMDVAFISAIETGGRKPPDNYINEFCNWLNLSEAQAREVRKRNQAAIIAFPSIKYVAKNSNSIRLFRKISKMDANQIRNFRKQGPKKDDG